MCDPGYSGAACDECAAGFHKSAGACVLDEQCQPTTCSGHGTCVAKNGLVSCFCDSGFTGTFCTACAPGFHRGVSGGCFTDERCVNDSCNGRGACSVTDGVVSCACNTGWTGARCTACGPGFHDASGECALDEQCLASSCSGHGTCSAQNGGVTCTCASGYTGASCNACAPGHHFDSMGACAVDPPATASVVVSPATSAIARLTTSEGGGSASFTLVLDGAPTSTVVVSLSSSQPDEGVVTPTIATFTTSTWNVPQRFVVTGVDDAGPDRTQPYAISLSVASSDSRFADPPDVLVENLDDETAGLTLRPVVAPHATATGLPTDASPLLTTSDGGAGTAFTLTLNTAPTGDVIVALTTSEATLCPTSLVFTPLNWRSPQTVYARGTKDFAVNGTHLSSLTATPTSVDPEYAAVPPLVVQMLSVDDESAGITLLPSYRVLTSELGRAARIQVVLDGQPSADVTVPLAIAPTGEAILSRSSVVFTALNWNAPQTVLVTGVDDALIDGDQSFTVTAGPAISFDPRYLGLRSSSVNGTNLDDEVPNVIVTPIDTESDEDGGTARFTIALTQAPVAPVVIAFTSSAPALGAPSPAAVFFDATNYSRAQTVVVSGRDDAFARGNAPYTISGQVVVGDLVGFPVPPVQLTNRDDDVPRVTLTQLSTHTLEEGGATPVVQITLEPAAGSPVTYALDTSDGTEGSVASMVTLSTTATVSVTGADDGDVDGNVPYALRLSANGGPSQYAAICLPDVELLNVDDESASVIVSNTSPTTTEAGGTGQAFVRLSLQPSATVNVALTSLAPDECTAPGTPLAFDGATWNTPQAATITGVDDDRFDAEQMCAVAVASSSLDQRYAALPLATIDARNQDDDFLDAERGHAFGEVANAAVSATYAWTITNTSATTSSSVLGSVTFTPASTDFAIVTNTCTPGNFPSGLPPGQSCAVGLRFTPQSTGQKRIDAFLQAATGGRVTVALTGTGL